MITPWGNKGVIWRRRWCKEQCQVHAGEEDHARPGWTTSRRGQDSPWKTQSEWQKTEINGESTSMVWPTLGSRTAREQNRTTTRWASLHYSMRPIVTDVPYVVCVFVCCPQPVSQFIIVSRCYKLRRQVTSTSCLSAMSRMMERLAKVK